MKGEKRMKAQYGRIISIGIFTLFLLACGGGGRVQTERSINDTPTVNSGSYGRDREVDQVEQALNGQKILYSWREGEAVYGTYFFETVHYCDMNYYILYGQSERTTILDNVQRNSWQAEGQWDVTRNQGQLGVHYQPRSGQDSFIPFDIQRDGRIYVDIANVSITHQGQAECR